MDDNWIQVLNGRQHGGLKYVVTLLSQADDVNSTFTAASLVWKSCRNFTNNFTHGSPRSRTAHSLTRLFCHQVVAEWEHGLEI